MTARANKLMFAIDSMAGRYGAACLELAYAEARNDRDSTERAERTRARRFRAVQRLTGALCNLAEAARVPAVRGLCDSYKDQPPPIFRGPGLSERGEGYNAGTRDLARAVLSTLDGDGA